mmetsp:Transcript_55367/g.142588  ORF Transcript_55367/g.142588 Transcript_55367/m.142588 type:complete len:358 (+) Transcript_55367:400-1473(+)
MITSVPGSRSRKMTSTPCSFSMLNSSPRHACLHFGDTGMRSGSPVKSGSGRPSTMARMHATAPARALAAPASFSTPALKLSLAPVRWPTGSNLRWTSLRQSEGTLKLPTSAMASNLVSAIIASASERDAITGGAAGVPGADGSGRRTSGAFPTGIWSSSAKRSSINASIAGLGSSGSSNSLSADSAAARALLLGPSACPSASSAASAALRFGGDASASASASMISSAPSRVASRASCGEESNCRLSRVAQAPAATSSKAAKAIALARTLAGPLGAASRSDAQGRAAWGPSGWLARGGGCRAEPRAGAAMTDMPFSTTRSVASSSGRRDGAGTGSHSIATGQASRRRRAQTPALRSPA